MSYRALVKLARSDMPTLASPLILQTILDRPDASSWHRILLSVGFLKKLRAEEAHNLLLDLAKGIGEKLEEQSYVRVGESEPPQHGAPQRAIKVTTEKYLAQLLSKAEFISNDAAVEVLVELFRAAQHRGTRLAALDSLLSLLDSICTGTQEEVQADPAVRRIMAALKTVVPGAGSINERRPLQAEDWAESKTTGILPDLSDMNPNSLPPLMKAVVSAGEFHPGLKRLEAEFLEQIILPVLEKSQQEHTAWIDMFLTKHQATSLKNDVPETPISPCLWSTVLRDHYPYTPKKYLEAFNRYAIHCIAPAPEVKKFSARLRADTELRKNHEVQHWLVTFDWDSADLSNMPTATLFRLLDRVQDQTAERGVLLDMIVQHATLYLDEYEKYTNVWDGFVNTLSPKSDTVENEIDFNTWYNKHRFIARQVIDLIRVKRKQGQRRVLPSTMKLQLWLIFTVGWYSRDDACEAFVTRLEQLLLSLLQEDEAGAFRWWDISRATCDVVQAVLNTEAERLRVAYHVGRLGRAREAAGEASRQLRVASDLIKVEVALDLMDQCERDKMGDSLKRRVEEWRACDSDAVRERVFRWEKNRSSL
ncbi:putative dna-binding protein hexbp [Diaporthe ampelina]|uniref:Putative dna-binding protein hexbp n=1 Tax=Diaporthe ampelina TaxID=1214573 RepID=A0A0G2HJ26_9PEZI|nr:putative dna-binding protein hexbp [Diaporthe ampelina]